MAAVWDRCRAVPPSNSSTMRRFREAQYSCRVQTLWWYRPFSSSAERSTKVLAAAAYMAIIRASRDSCSCLDCSSSGGWGTERMSIHTYRMLQALSSCSSSDSCHWLMLIWTGVRLPAVADSQGAGHTEHRRLVPPELPGFARLVKVVETVGAVQVLLERFDQVMRVDQQAKSGRGVKPGKAALWPVRCDDDHDNKDGGGHPGGDDHEGGYLRECLDPKQAYKHQTSVEHHSALADLEGRDDLLGDAIQE
eukprot:scaffold65546_cov49-Prasinocladus_malaysianus.AAC.1